MTVRSADVRYEMLTKCWLGSRLQKGHRLSGRWVVSSSGWTLVLVVLNLRVQLPERERVLYRLAILIEAFEGKCAPPVPELVTYPLT